MGEQKIEKELKGFSYFGKISEKISKKAVAAAAAAGSLIVLAGSTFAKGVRGVKSEKEESKTKKKGWFARRKEKRMTEQAEFTYKLFVERGYFDSNKEDKEN